MNPTDTTAQSPLLTKRFPTAAASPNDGNWHAEAAALANPESRTLADAKAKLAKAEQAVRDAEQDAAEALLDEQSFQNRCAFIANFDTQTETLRVAQANIGDPTGLTVKFDDLIHRNGANSMAWINAGAELAGAREIHRELGAEIERRAVERARLVADAKAFAKGVGIAEAKWPAALK